MKRQRERGNLISYSSIKKPRLTGTIRTVQEWFDFLDEPFRSKAMEYAKSHYGEKVLRKRTDSLMSAIDTSMVWSDTDEGIDYWHNVSNASWDTGGTEYLKRIDQSPIHEEYLLSRRDIRKHVCDKIGKPQEDIRLLAYDVGCRYSGSEFLDYYRSSNDIIFTTETTRIVVHPVDLTNHLLSNSKLFSDINLKVIYLNTKEN